MKSIKTRMTISLLTAILFLMALGTATVYVSVHSWMIAQFDQALLEKTRALAGMMTKEHGHINFELLGDLMPEFSRETRPEYFQIRAADGKSIERSRSLKGDNLTWPKTVDTSPIYWNLRLPGGRMGRAIYNKIIPVIGDEGEEGEEHGTETREHSAAQSMAVQIMLARDRNELDKNLAILLWGALGFSVIMLLGVGLVIPFVVRWGLKPVLNLANHIQTVDSNTLDQRLSTHGIPHELETVYSNYNELLGRIQEAFLREKRLTANMAHELKTPISELRALADVSLKHPNDVGFALDSLKDVRHVAILMESIVSAMLSLARAEAGQESLEQEPTDLVALINQQWQGAVDIGSHKSIDATLKIPGSMTINSNPAMLTCILRNVFENAFEYCPENGKVNCRLTKTESHAVLELQNSNTTLEKDDLPHLMKPLWRKQTSRSDENHVGLGLTLVQAFAQALSATVEVSIEPNNDVKLRLSFLINSDENT